MRTDCTFAAHTYMVSVAEFDYRAAGAEEVVEKWCDALLLAFRGIESAPREQIRAYLRGDHVLYLAREGSEVVGGVLCRPDGTIWCMFVAERYRRLGLGTQLLRAAVLRHDRDSVVYDVRDQVRPWYERNGFAFGVDGSTGVYCKAI